MIAIAAVVVLVVVVTGVAWARLASARAERRSLQGYEKSLDLLGDVAKRSEAVADVQVPAADELARPHVRPAPGARFPGPAPNAVRMVPPPRVRLAPPILPGSPAGRVPVFGDADLVGASRAGDAVPDAPNLGSVPLDAPLTDIVAATRAALRPTAGPSARGLPGASEPPQAPRVFDPPTEIYAVVPAPAEDAPTVGDPVGAPTVRASHPPVEADGTSLFDFDSRDNAAGVGTASSPPGRLELTRATRGSAARARAGARSRAGAGGPVGVGSAGGAGGAGGAVDAGGTEGSERVRRAATGAAAAVVVGAIAVGGWQLASHRSPSVAASNQPTGSSAPPAKTTGHGASGTSKSTRKSSAPTTPVAPTTTLQPTSTSSSLVTYRVPAGPYTVGFKATTGACWLGAQSRASSSAYLQMWTLQPGQSASYAASGPLVIKIGAPHYVAITVDGKPVVLPSFATPYDISFSASSGTAA